MSKKENLLLFCDLLKKNIENETISEERIDYFYDLLIQKSEKLEPKTIRSLILGNYILSCVENIEYS